MSIKKIEEMDYYELLNLERHASQEEIENAYLAGIATYHPNSLASYSLISKEEREFILKRIEEAFQILGNSEKRKFYDLKINNNFQFCPKASFRKSTRKLEIEDAEEKKRIWRKLKNLFFPKKRKKEKQENLKKADPFDINNHNLLRGEYLKKVREIRGLSLEEISKAIKMSVSQLEALEEEYYEILPKETNISHLIGIYAHHLGLNHKDK
jgi:DnaJ-class molecular chaperone